MPWSWLIDWFSNVGDVIANLSSNGIADLTYDYAYLMRHASTRTEWSLQIPQHKIAIFDGVPAVDLPRSSTGSVTELKETKERVAATPFGFGVQFDDLSVRQIAILSALGLSRLNF
jgi:hypothetical protein